MSTLDHSEYRRAIFFRIPREFQSVINQPTELRANSLDSINMLFAIAFCFRLPFTCFYVVSPRADPKEVSLF